MSTPPPSGPEVGRERFEDVLEQFGPALMRLASAYTSTTADRDDLFQEICLGLWQALPRFRGESSLRTFVYRIGHNRGLTFRAQRHRQRLVSLDEVGDPAAGGRAPDEAVSARDEVARLRAAVQRLPPLLIQAVVLLLEGLSTREIATVLGITENNAAVRLTRARQALRSLLATSEEA